MVNTTINEFTDVNLDKECPVFSHTLLALGDVNNQKQSLSSQQSLTSDNTINARIKRYIREPFPALSHFLGAALSVLAFFCLMQKTGDSTRATIASSIYACSLILLYLASTLTHGLNCHPKTAAFLERCDHAAIFLLIAGTYTPICLLMIPGPTGWLLLVCEWILAFTGIYYIFAKPFMRKSLRVLNYIGMGWLFLFAIDPLISSLPNALLAWLIGGGLFYSIGSIFFITNRPNLWPGYFEAHDLWHLWVLGGSTCHFIFINRYLMKLNV